MLAVIWKILGILGIILLAILGVLVLILLLVLFWPVTYRVEGKRSEEALTAGVRVSWLCGLLRAVYRYPEPGKLVVKLAGITVFDSSEKAAGGRSAGKAQRKAGEAAGGGQQTADCEQQTADGEQQTMDCEQQTMDGAEEAAGGKKTLREKLFAKYEKIKYTIKRFCDKIKHILGQLEFYGELLQDEDTRGLISHVCARIGKILRHIRPRKLRADITFGTGSPDTTGYAYGVYGMLSPKLGEDVRVTPDFEERTLVGEIHAAGHITVFTLLVHLLAIVLDRRLRLLIRRLKSHRVQTA